MARFHWVGLGLALLVTGLLALGAPGVAAAAPDSAAFYAYQPGSDGPDPNSRNLLSLPGVFTLRLGQTTSTRDGALRFDGTQVELPGINATAEVDGFTFNLRDGSYGWDAITVTQMGPRESDAFTLSNTQVSVQGPAANFSTDVSARVEVHPNPEVQAGATIGFSYDGLTSQAGLAVADGNAQVTAGPATITVEGLDAGEGALSVDAAQVMFPQAETGVRVTP